MNFWQAAAILAGCSIGVGVLLLLVVFLIRFRFPVRRQDTGEDLSHTLTVRDDSSDMVRQLEQAGDVIDKRIESHMAELRKLLAQVSAASQDLDAKIRHINSSEGLYHGSPGLLSDDKGEESTTANPQQAEVLRLSGQGVDAIEIARRTGMSMGEVELVLHLHASQSE